MILARLIKDFKCCINVKYNRNLKDLYSESKSIKDPIFSRVLKKCFEYPSRKTNFKVRN